MISAGTFEYLSEYLRDKISPSIEPNYGFGDQQPKKDKEAELTRLFRNWVYRNGMGYFLMNKSGVVYVYNGKYYESAETKTFLREVVRFTLESLKVATVYCEFTHKKIESECLVGMENNPLGIFTPDRRYIVFNNGVLDLETCELGDFSMDKRTDLILDFDYDPEAKSALWDNLLVQIIPNPEMRDALQKFIGSLLLNKDKYKVEYCCYIIGPGSNGKSVIAGAIATTFGKRYFTEFQPKQLLTTSDSMFNLAEMDGKIANFTDDLDKDDLSGGQFKKFVSGQEFQARHPYGHKIFKVKAPPLLCCTNNPPVTTDDSWGHHRRQLLIQSSSRIWTEEDKDSTLGYKLAEPEHRAAIFNWAIDGLKKIIANNGNIELGKDVIQAQLDLRDDSNSLRRWIRDSCLVKINPVDDMKDIRWKSLSAWHKLYREYCDSMGDRSPQNAKSMGKLFKEKGYEYKHRADGAWYCIGTVDVDSTADGEPLNGAVIDPFGSVDNSNLPF